MKQPVPVQCGAPKPAPLREPSRALVRVAGREEGKMRGMTLAPSSRGEDEGKPSDAAVIPLMHQGNTEAFAHVRLFGSIPLFGLRAQACPPRAL